jgi:2-keto-3-deoxy-6-phosphogluconate aldolase
VDANSIPDWRKVNVDGYGIGSSLYVPGMSATEIGKAAVRSVKAVRVS